MRKAMKTGDYTFILKGVGVTDIVRASSSAKDEAPPSMSGAGAGAGDGAGERAGAGAGAGAGAMLVELLPKKSARGKSAAFFLDFAWSN